MLILPRFSKAALALSLALLALAPAHAATITVATTDVTSTTQCNLVDAITAANLDTATNACPAGSGADVIELPANSTHTLTVANNGGNGLPLITTAITINGHGSTITRSTAANTPDFRLFTVTRSGSGSTLTLNDLTVSNGRVVSGGGGLLVGDGTILTLNRSTVSGNTVLTVRNRASGGGISISGGTATLNHSTVSGNSSAVNAGGISVSNGTATLNHSTVTGNSASIGGGINSEFGGTITLQNSLVAGNTATGGGAELEGNMTSLGNNLIGHSGLSYAQAAGGGPTLVASDLVATNTTAAGAAQTGTALDAIFNTVTNGVPQLANNGGPTPTVALKTGSPAIDAANATTCAQPANNKDQRGANRPAGNGCDIGAFESAGTFSQTVNNTSTNSKDVRFSSANVITDLSALDPKAEKYTAPAGMAFSDVGLYNFKLNNVANGGVVTVTITLPVGTNVIGYVKCDAGTLQCVNFPAPAGPNMQGAVINANVITLTLVDGVTPGDSDGANNGTITDPGAPVIAAPASGASGGGALGALLLLPLGLFAALRRKVFKR